MSNQRARKNNWQAVRTKMVSIMLILMLALSTSVTAYASGITGLTSATLEGIMMSKERFVETYASMHRANIERSTFETCALDMEEITVSGETLSFAANLYQGNSEGITFEVGGTLYSGYKNQMKEMNSVIVDAKTDSEEVSVLLFEMMFDLDKAAGKVNAKQELNTYENCFMTTEPIVSTASVRLYLCIDDVIYMFEDALPTIFNQCNQEYQQMSDPMKDMLWFASLVTPTVTMEQVSETDEMFVEATANTRASDAGSVLWTGNRTYTYRFDVYGEEYVQRSLPFGYYRICDVATSVTPWKAEFYICENTSVGGEKITGVDNLLRYKNIQISMVVGEGTEFSESEIDGCVIEKRESWFDNNNLIVDILSASVEWWDLGQSIVNVFASLKEVEENVCLGTEFSSLYTSGTTAISSKIHYSRGELHGNSYSSEEADLVKFDSSSHYLILQGDVHSNLAGAVNAVNTTGCIQFEWDVFLNSTLEDFAVGQKRTFTKAYTVTH